jgi:hypothetical protein
VQVVAQLGQQRGIRVQLAELTGVRWLAASLFIVQLELLESGQDPPNADNPVDVPGLGTYPRHLLANTGLTGHQFVTAPNKFEVQRGLDNIVSSSATLRGVAVALMKIANDIRWLASGPPAGIGELCLPANEPGAGSCPAR